MVSELNPKDVNVQIGMHYWLVIQQVLPVPSELLLLVIKSIISANISNLLPWNCLRENVIKIAGRAQLG